MQAFKKLQKNGVSLLLTKPEPTKATNWKVAFEPPSAIQLVGGWPLQLTVLNRSRWLTVDLALEMPYVSLLTPCSRQRGIDASFQTLFQEKDYLDARFFHKRAYYLAVVASSLLKSGLGVEVEYETPGDNLRRSALLVTPIKGISHSSFGIITWKQMIC